MDMGATSRFETCVAWRWTGTGGAAPTTPHVEGSLANEWNMPSAPANANGRCPYVHSVAELHEGALDQGALDVGEARQLLEARGDQRNHVEI
eukprot:14150260-Alexandrium_andersonii.AAC.1